MDAIFSDDDESKDILAEYIICGVAGAKQFPTGNPLLLPFVNAAVVEPIFASLKSVVQCLSGARLFTRVTTPLHSTLVSKTLRG